MPTDYSPLDALPAPQGSDVASVTAFTALRSAIDGKLTLTCTSATRPTGTARFTGRLIFETDTKMWRTWNGSRWAWTGGAPEVLALTLPAVASVAAAFVTFPVVAGGTVAAQTNDPDSAFVVVTTAGSQGVQCRDAGWYYAWAAIGSSIAAADAIASIHVGTVIARDPFGKSGDAAPGASFKVAAGETIIPKVYTYSGSQTYSGTLYVRKVAEL